MGEARVVAAAPATDGNGFLRLDAGGRVELLEMRLSPRWVVRPGGEEEHVLMIVVVVAAWGRGEDFTRKSIFSA